MSSIPMTATISVVSTLPETGTALSVATTKSAVVVCVVPEAVWALATMVCGPDARGVVGVYTQLPFASAVTVTVVAVSE